MSLKSKKFSQAQLRAEAGLGYLHGVVVWLPAFQLLETEEALGQVGLILGGAVDEAGRGHLQGRARLRPGEGHIPKSTAGPEPRGRGRPKSREPTAGPEPRGRGRRGSERGFWGGAGRPGTREAARSHPFRGAGAALQEGPVLERRDSVVLEVELPGRGQRRGAHPSAAERCRDSNPAVAAGHVGTAAVWKCGAGRRGACWEL